MENKTAKLIGVAAAVATGAMLSSPGQAVPRPIPVASSYAELLTPVADAASRLAADDAAAPAQDMGGGSVDHHHHHHHSRRWYRQHGYVWNGRAWVLRPVHHHHHHHHHN